MNRPALGDLICQHCGRSDGTIVGELAISAARPQVHRVYVHRPACPGQVVVSRPERDLDDAIFAAERYGDPIPGASTPGPLPMPEPLPLPQPEPEPSPWPPAARRTR